MEDTIYSTNNSIFFMQISTYYPTEVNIFLLDNDYNNCIANILVLYLNSQKMRNSSLEVLIIT